MQSRLLFGAAFVAASFPLLLAGCSGSTSSVAPATQPAAKQFQGPAQRHSTLLLGLSRTRHAPLATHSWMKHVNPKTSLLYLSDAYANDVNIYDAAGSNQTPIGQITGLNQPQGLWVNVNQNLWLANTGAQALMEFHRGSVVPYRTVTDPNGYPAGICGNNNKALTYGVDILANGGGYGNTINVYAKNDTSPSQVLTDTNSEALYDCVVDKNGNLFVTLSNLTGYGEVDEFAKGSTTPVTLISNLIYPIGITIDKYGTLAVNDADANYPYCCSVIYLYDPPYTYGPAFSFETNGFIIETALDRTQTHLWMADTQNFDASEWSYPHGSFENATSNQGLQYPDGIALSPPAKQ
ncbi:MAG: hypothetical protein JO146_06615 [Candidatus Eremiobacteraeota bacterium]|nr:hypothetical protein [Candidatus Eremiobacteraeota bacterium]